VRMRQDMAEIEIKIRFRQNSKLDIRKLATLG
jgi:hypothetical protein